MLRVRVGVITLALLAGSGVLCPALAQSPPPASASGADMHTAQAKYEEGVRLLNAGRAKDALAAFRASHELVASPNSGLMIARTEVEIGELTQAYEAYEAVERSVRDLHDAKYQMAGESAAQERQELANRIALVTLHVKESGGAAKVTIGDAEIGRDRWERPLPMRAGPTVVVAKAPDGRSVERRVALDAGRSADVELDLTPPATTPPAPPPPDTNLLPSPYGSTQPSAAPPSDRPTRERTSLLPFAAVAGGVGVIGLGVFAVAGALARSHYDDLQTQCPNHVCSQDLSAEADQGHTEQTIANVGITVGLLGLGTGITLLVIDRAQANPSAGSKAGATVAVGPANVSLRGRF